jgi:formylglycine-generating enzyme required for sulfatase activity
MGTYEGAPYLVSELLEGGTLRQRLAADAVPLRKAIDYSVQIARGLAAAHEKGVIHRDLKPDNLFVTRDDRVKILDFGLAKLIQPPGGLERASGGAGELTEPGLMMGTIGYMSPEQVRGEPADYRADIFAFGVILWEMLTGKRAFQKPTSIETMSAILKEEPPAVSEITSNMPPGLARVVHRCLEKSPERRFQSAADLAFALEALSDPGQPTTFARREGRTRTRTGVIAGSLVALVALAWAAWFLWPRLHPASHASGAAELRAGDKDGQQGEEHKAKLVHAKKVEEHSATVVPVASRTEKGALASAGKVKVNPSDGLKYVWIPPGKFAMGCSPDDLECEPDEKPAHEVTITKGFWIGQTEVTQAAYEHVIGRDPSVSQAPELPVNWVTWFQANGYCQAIGMRLPTEAEWEYAARAGNVNDRYGVPAEIAWYFGNSQQQTHPVAQKQANSYGLYDILGNVAEWTADWYGPYTAHSAVDPKGAAEGEFRVVRGGSWFGHLKMIRFSGRVMRKPGAHGDFIGFRCAGE